MRIESSRVLQHIDIRFQREVVSSRVLCIGNVSQTRVSSGNEGIQRRMQTYRLPRTGPGSLCTRYIMTAEVQVIRSVLNIKISTVPYQGESIDFAEGTLYQASGAVGLL